MPTPTLAQPTANDRHLCRLLKATGFILIAASIYFLVHNVGYGVGDDYFFGFCLLLGTLCCLSACQPRARTTRGFRFSLPAFRPTSATHLAIS